jgi:GxxExxY protein
VLIETGFRIDVLADEYVIAEIKAVEAIIPVHEAQLLTQLKLANIRLGLLLNFNVPLMRHGMKRMVI